MSRHWEEILKLPYKPSMTLENIEKVYASRVSNRYKKGHSHTNLNEAMSNARSNQRLRYKYSPTMSNRGKRIRSTMFKAFARTLAAGGAAAGIAANAYQAYKNKIMPRASTPGRAMLEKWGWVQPQKNDTAEMLATIKLAGAAAFAAGVAALMKVGLSEHSARKVIEKAHKRTQFLENQLSKLVLEASEINRKSPNAAPLFVAIKEKEDELRRHIEDTDKMVYQITG